MVGMLHLEARATRDGVVRVYLTDLWRRPMSLAGVTGHVTLDAAGARRDLPLEARDEGTLEAKGAPLAGSDVPAHVRLLRAGAPVEANFMLPIGGASGGAAGIPLEGCRPETAENAPRLRCVLRFPEPVTAITATADGARLLVSGLGVGVSAWTLPEARFAGGLAPPPPIAAPPDAAPHAESANAIAARRDGAEAVVGIERRLLVYELAHGTFARELPSLPGVVRSLAWSPDGRTILASVFYDPTGHLLDAADGHERRRLEVEREAAAVAFAPDGGRAAVGSETGTVALFDLAAAAAPRTAAPPARAIQCLDFVGERLLFPGSDGILAWSPATGDVVALPAGGGPPLRLAVSAEGRLIATADIDGAVRVRDARDGTIVDSLTWHHGAVIGLAWAGSTLVSADFEGRVALWDFSRTPIDGR